MMILVQIIILETAGLYSGHDIGNQCHTALGCLGLVLIINQNIWKETFEDIVDAIIETLSQDCLNMKSSRSVARHHGEPQLPQLSVQVKVPGVLVAVADDHIVHTPKGGPQVALYRD